MKQKFQLWLVAAVMVAVVLLFAFTVIYLASVSPLALIVLIFIGVSVCFRYTIAEDVLDFIKWKWL